MIRQPFQPNFEAILFLSALLFSFSAAHRYSITTRELPSAHHEQPITSQNHPYLPEHRSAVPSNREFLSPKPDKNVISQSSFVFNRKLHNLDESKSTYSHTTHSTEQSQQTFLPSNQWERERQELPSSSAHFSSDKPLDSAIPFSISIEGKSFYGGLITYSHDLHPARICRVMNACIRNDDTLVLPQWMQRHDNTLKFQCGYPNIEFSLPDNESPPSLKKLDLVGIKSSRPSIPDFIKDFMPSATVFDLVYGDHQMSKSCHSRRGKDCYSFPSLQESFRPSVILHPRLRLLADQKCWVRQFVALMEPPHSKKQIEILYEDSFREKAADMTCFRSVLFTRGPFNRNIIMDDHLRQIHFLARHGIVKKPRDVMPPQDSLTTSQVCTLNVTISNRKRVDGAHNRLVGRYITNIPAVRNAILERAERIPGLHLNIATMTLEDKSLRWQINAMQKTDIWVAGHGPLLTNMIFLREKSSVLEVQPFAYYPQTYEMIADRLAHVSYERYIADPDVEAFKICIGQVYGDAHPAYKEASNVLDRYMQASKKYFESDNTHSLILHNLDGEYMLQVKTCAQMQRLAMNARNFAIAVVRHARIRCGLPKPGLENSEAGRNQIPEMTGLE